MADWDQDSPELRANLKQRIECMCMGSLRVGAYTSLRQRQRPHRSSPRKRDRAPLWPAALRAIETTSQPRLSRRRRSFHARRLPAPRHHIRPDAQCLPIRRKLASDEVLLHSPLARCKAGHSTQGHNNTQTWFPSLKTVSWLRP